MNERAYARDPAARGASGLGAPEDRLAARAAAFALLLGPLLAASLALPQPESPDTTAAIVLGGLSLASALGFLLAERTGRAGPALTYGAAPWMIGLVAALVAATGGTRSLYAALYLLPLVHAAAFQSRTGFLANAAAIVGAFAAPAAYDGAHDEFATLALVAVPPVLLAGLALNLATGSIHDERDQLAERERAALRLADEDPLTGLSNYRVFWRQLQAEASRVRRHGSKFSLVLIDLDRFKGINDEFGHTAGDRVLQRTAEALAGAVRGEDVLCRQGGDEFGVIAVQAGREEVSELAERLVEAVGRAPGHSEREPQITASAGFATFPEDATTAEELVARADEALRLAKRRGRAAATPALPPTEPVPQPEPAVARRSGPGVAHLPELAALARALASGRDPQSIALTAVAHAAGAIDCVGAAVLRWDRARRQLELSAFSGRLPSGTERRVPDDRGMLGVVVREGRGMTAHAGQGNGTGSAGTGSELAAPVAVGDEVWGALHLVSDRPDAYGPDDLALAEAMAEQVGRALACAWVVGRLEGARNSQVDWLADAVEDPGSRSRRVADLAERVGQALGLEGEPLRDLRYSALFHDIGTIGVPAPLLHKPGRLTSEERAVMREHVIHGERILRRVPHLRDAARIVRHAHERVDGAGYPDGLAGEQIPLASRVVLACDSYVAMTSPRPYRDPLTRGQALAELRRSAGTQLDRDVVEVLVSVLGDAG